jgi:hypothetical protein
MSASLLLTSLAIILTQIPATGSDVVYKFLRVCPGKESPQEIENKFHGKKKRRLYYETHTTHRMNSQTAV